MFGNAATRQASEGADAPPRQCGRCQGLPVGIETDDACDRTPVALTIGAQILIDNGLVDGFEPASLRCGNDRIAFGSASGPVQSGVFLCT